MRNEETPAALRLFAEISEKENIEIRLYPRYLREIADEIEQLQKKVKRNGYSPLQHWWMRRLRRNPLGVLADAAKIETETEVQKWEQLAHRAFKLAVGHGWDPEVFSTMDEALEAYEARRD